MIPFEKFTEQARTAFGRAQELLVRLRHNALDTEHLLFVLLGQGEGLVAEGLARLQVDRRPLLEQLQKQLGQRPSVGERGPLYMTNRLKTVIDLAVSDAEQRGDDFVGTEHLLLATLSQQDDPAAQLMLAGGLEKQALTQAFDEVRGGRKVGDAGAESRLRVLEKYAVDLTAAREFRRRGDPGPGNGAAGYRRSDPVRDRVWGGAAAFPLKGRKARRR